MTFFIFATNTGRNAETTQNHFPCIFISVHIRPHLAQSGPLLRGNEIIANEQSVHVKMQRQMLRLTILLQLQIIYFGFCVIQLFKLHFPCLILRVLRDVAFEDPFQRTKKGLTLATSHKIEAKMYENKARWNASKQYVPKTKQ